MRGKRLVFGLIVTMLLLVVLAQHSASATEPPVEEGAAGDTQADLSSPPDISGMEGLVTVSLKEDESVESICFSSNEVLTLQVDFLLSDDMQEIVGNRTQSFCMTVGIQQFQGITWVNMLSPVQSAPQPIYRDDTLYYVSEFLRDPYRYSVSFPILIMEKGSDKCGVLPRSKKIYFQKLPLDRAPLETEDLLTA